jgi:hypothetical protein
MSETVRVRRLPVTDQLERDGEWLLLVDDRAVRVTGLAPVILGLTDDWLSLEALVGELERVFGDAPDDDATALVRQAVDELAGQDLLELEIT